MDAETIFNLLKPQLKNMGKKEKQSLSKMIVGKVTTKRSRKVVMSVKEAKEKIKLFRAVEKKREHQLKM